MNAAIKTLEQNTTEWLEHRRKFRNASETPAVMGCSPWFPKTHKELARVKRGLADIFVNDAMKRGTTLEASARKLYEDTTGEAFEPHVVVDGDYSASLDGMSFDRETILEIKCPAKGQDSDLWQEVKAQKIPNHYWYQMQHQLMVSKAKLCNFVVYDGIDEYIEIQVIPDTLAHQAIHEAWDTFWPLMDCDEAELIEVVQRDDTQWQLAVEAYKYAKGDLDKAQAEMTEAKDTLIALADKQNTAGCGVAVIQVSRKGNINYRHKDVKAALTGIDLEQYRGKASSYWKVIES